MSYTANKERIARNTLLLYLRTIVTIIVSLYSSRLILKVLGVEDYGVYNVIGGVVILFSIISNSVTTGIQRFINVEIGKGDYVGAKRIFGNALSLQFIFGLFVLLMTASVGLWFVNNRLNIPEHSLHSANVVYFYTVITLFITLCRTPYNAAIIASEKMGAFAYLSIIDVILKLASIVILRYYFDNKLEMYALFIFISTAITSILFYIYNNRCIEISRTPPLWDRSTMKLMLSFSGWNIFGATAHMFKDQGVNILLNIFSGPAANAARGISSQIYSAIYNFIFNFQMASRPQIISLGASGNEKQMVDLANSTAKLSFFMMIAISTPIYCELDTILKVWLDNVVPPHTLIFAQLSIAIGLIEVFANPISTIVHATGKMKWFQIVCGSTILLITPVAYIFLKAGYPPQSAFVVSLFIGILTQIVRVIMVRRLVDFPLRSYFEEVLLPVAKVMIPSIALLYMIRYSLSESGVVYSVIRMGLSFLSTITIIILLGTNLEEREYIKNKLYKNGKKI